MAAILKVKDENGNVIPIQAIQGEKGEKGDKGDRGEQGIPGTVNGLPSGGYTGQTLVKNSNDNGDISWGGDGLDFDSEMVIPMFPNGGKMLYIRVAPNKKPKFLGEGVTQISSGAENIVSNVYSDGYALGYAVFSATMLGDLARMNASFFRNAENAVIDFDRLISGGYISNPVYLCHGDINYMSVSKDVVDPIGRNCMVYYSKGTKSSRLDITTADRAISLLYYYNESDIEDYYKNNFYVSGKCVVHVAYDRRGEKYSLHPQSYAGRILGIDENGDTDYRTPSDLGLLTSSQGTENAGKVLTVGSDGIVVPTAFSGGGGSYTLPVASSTTLGGVKIGDGITIGDDGTISASGGSGEKEWRLLQTVEIAEPVASFAIDKDADGNPFSVNEIHIVASNITVSADMNPLFFYAKDQPSYQPTHQIINGSFTGNAKYWNFYAFSHGKLAIFTLTSQWNNGALQYVPVNREIPGSKIAYFKLSVQYSGQTLNTGTFKIYGR